MLPGELEFLSVVCSEIRASAGMESRPGAKVMVRVSHMKGWSCVSHGAGSMWGTCEELKRTHISRREYKVIKSWGRVIFRASRA